MPHSPSLGCLNISLRVFFFFFFCMVFFIVHHLESKYEIVVVVVVALLFYVHGKHLRSRRDGQLT